MIDGVHKKVGIVGTHFFFQGYEVLVNERNATINFAAPPTATRRRNNIEVVYTYDPTVSAPRQSLIPPQSAYAMYPTTQATQPLMKSMVPEPKRREIFGWRESDYLDYTDFENAIRDDLLIPYALCQWLARQAHGNPSDPFTDGEWEDWFDYAIEHCPRFASEQPRHR